MKFAVPAAAIICAVFFAGPAAAAVCISTSGTCLIDAGPLSETNPIAIQDQNVAPGAYTAEGEFEIGPDVAGADAFVSVAFDRILPGQTEVAAGFANLAITFLQDGASLGTFLLTNPDGTTEGGLAVQTLTLSFLTASTVFFEIVGDAFLNSGASLPDFNINISAIAAEIPAPGAFYLLLSGVAGLAFASRRRAPRPTR